MEFKRYFTDLSAMMARRHLIAHRADSHRRKLNLTNPIGAKLVEGWLSVVDSFGSRLLSSL